MVIATQDRIYWTRPQPAAPTPTGEERIYWTRQQAPTDIYGTQVDTFNKHLQEFYREDRGDQTYLDFLDEKYPSDAGQLTSDFITAVNQTQPELLGTQANFFKAHPVDESTLEKVLGIGGRAL